MNSVNSHNELKQRSQFDNDSQVLHNNSGIEKADSGEYQEAIKEFSNEIALNPMDAKSYFHRATLKVRLGDLEGARTDFEMAENCHRKLSPKLEDYPLL